MKTIEKIKINTVAQYNETLLNASDTLTGQQFRRLKRKNKNKVLISFL